MEGARVVWNTEQQRQLRTLGFAYNDDRDKWTKNAEGYDELVWATADFLYWFSTETHNGGKVAGSNKFPILHFDALIIFLRAIRAIEGLRK